MLIVRRSPSRRTSSCVPTGICTPTPCETSVLCHGTRRPNLLWYLQIEKVYETGRTMRLGEKLQHLREVEGQLRGLERPLSLTDVTRLMREELGVSLSLPYLSQIERGSRPHLTG